MTKAKQLFYARNDYGDGSIIEIKLWRLPTPTAERPHGLKYSLFVGCPGERWVCYDNERGKGDHKHFLGAELKYDFVDVPTLFNDFRADILMVRRMK